jgi:GntR family transcriptional regulator
MQIANTLKEEIENEKFLEGSLLPTEEDLEKQFNASRTTIRNAIGLLEKLGYVIRKQGKGTIVQGFKTVQKLNYISSITETLEQKGMHVKTGTLSVRLVKPPLKIISNLNINENENVYLIQRVKIADDTPIAFINNYLLPSKVPNLEEKVQSLQHIGLYHLLEKEYHLKLHSAVETISVYLSGPLDIEIFNIPKNMPLFLTNRITYLDDGTIFESATSIIRADKYEFTVYLKGRP